MEIYNNSAFSHFADEDPNSIQSPSRMSFIKTLPDSDSHFMPTTVSSPSPRIPFMPPSPESPWTLTPIHPTPSASLLYLCVSSLHRQDGNLFSIAVLKGLIFTGSNSTRIRIWKQPECVEYGYFKTTSGEIRALLAYGNVLFTAHKDYRVRVWNISVSSDNFRSKKIATLPRRNTLLFFPKSNSQQHKSCISCIAYYHAEGLLYTGSWDRTVKTWRLCDKRCVDSFVAHEDNVNAIVVKQENGCVFTASCDGSVKIWRRVNGENSHTLIMTLRFQPSPVKALALSTSAHSCILYSGSSDGYINVWEKEKVSGRYNHGGFLQGHRFAILSLITIETLVISGSEDTTIRVWRREEGSNIHSCLSVLEGHRGPVRCLAACLEKDQVLLGYLVYSGSLDGTLKVWRLKVLPSEKVSVEEQERNDEQIMKTYEMSPVLSPSWVEKKLQGS
ncbi:hypothetical protein IFM89_003767 [Coptis chinensis]|uniref:Uncharacterized protein n=1 Tax=Coptis chinensis TaxID=261450 RepID=A0A835M1C4_9MAGN|nr:hypothetical protein IFM89_003767 [Coptis chinensis]